MLEEKESLMPDFNFRVKTSPGVRKGEVAGPDKQACRQGLSQPGALCSPALAWHFLCGHLVTGLITGTGDCAFLEVTLKPEKSSSAERGLEELKQGADISSWCLLQTLFTPSAHLPPTKNSSKE